MSERILVHEVTLDGYKATADHKTLDFGTWGSYGIEKLHLNLGKAWEGLVVTAHFNVKGEAVATALADVDNMIQVPWEATKESTFSGNIVFEGAMNGQRRMTANQKFKVTNHADFTGSDPVPSDDKWNQFVTETKNYREDAMDAAERAMQTETEVGALGDEKKQALQEESEKQQAAIEKKGKDTLESIPEDYGELSEDVGDLKDNVGQYLIRKHIETKVTEKASYVLFRFNYSVKKGEHIYVKTSYTGDNLSLIDIRTYDPDGGYHLIKTAVPIGSTYAFIAEMDYAEFSFYRSVDTIVEGNTLTVEILVYGLFGKKIEENSTKIEENSTKIEENSTKIEESLDIKYYNLIDPTTIIENASIVKDNGSLYQPNQYNDATDYILLKKNTDYYVGGIFMANFYAFYDMSKTFLSNPDATITVASNNNWKGMISVGSEDLYFRGTIRHGNSGAYISNYKDTYHSYGIVPINEQIIYEIKSAKLKDKKVLVIGDSISSDAYQNYKKWVTDLMDDGYFPSDTINNSYHATGFVATYKESGVVKQDNFVNRIQAISDKDSFDLVVVFGGINDYIQSVPMGESDGDKATQFKPAVDFFFEYLAKNFTQARIAVLLPLRTYNIYKNIPDGDQSKGFYQTEYSEYIHTVAKKYCLPVLNLTEESGFYPFIDEFKDKWTLLPTGYTSHDGVHPTEEYSKKYLAPMIWGFLSGLI